jgi:HPt (histidine-containing phosphotransfer) domain-containing protein
MDDDLNKSAGTQLLCSAASSVVASQDAGQDSERGVGQSVVSAATPELPLPAAWSIEELMLRLDGDQEFLRELLVIFQQDARSDLEKSRDAMARGDFEALSRAAHTLKGMLRNLAMGRAALVAAALEDAARKSMPEASAMLLPQLQMELEGLLPEVEAQLAEVKR